MYQSSQNEIEITILVRNVVAFYDPDYEDEIKKIKICNEATIIELLYKADFIDDQAEMVGDLTHYYQAIINREYYQHRLLPFLITTDNNLLLEVPYSNATIKDFIYTHNITDKTINVQVGFPAASAGWEVLPEVIVMWDHVIRVVVTLSYLGIFYRWVVSKVMQYKNKKRKGIVKMSPDVFFSLVLSREEWSPQEFSNITGIDIRECKMLFEISGYKWDPQTKKYKGTDNIEELSEKIVDMHQDLKS